jgi:hypothetical protein
VLEVTATAANETAHIGDTINAPAGANLQLTIHTAACEGSKVEFLLDGKPVDTLPQQAIDTADKTIHAEWPSDGNQHWLETDVVTREGQLQLLGNPIYVNWKTTPITK